MIFMASVEHYICGYIAITNVGQYEMIYFYNKRRRYTMGRRL